MTIEFELNGKAVTYSGDPDTPLLWALRDDFGLKGTKYGCGVAQCGACTVHVDGMNRRACVAPVSSMEGRSVTSIEGLTGAVAEAVQGAWVALNVPQCGYCQSGQIMSAIGLLGLIEDPSDADIDAAMAGNICRCVTYGRIRSAILQAAQKVKA
ncbi:(2Fe-2S)-binding protein [Roseibium limicola]|uniref:(2Fe-2S)-binding protein n=1 Tax=Roseibium limicola TaxID=2816037 RepID=A0A939J584_9HYPH|nr:(2Fe-2S)-binding protein [Roseibium limicola]MBO0345530.1 (2Fe-2S)-binding protein [Roseibium limicola]